MRHGAAWSSLDAASRQALRTRCHDRRTSGSCSRMPRTANRRTETTPAPARSVSTAESLTGSDLSSWWSNRWEGRLSSTTLCVGRTDFLPTPRTQTRDQPPGASCRVVHAGPDACVSNPLPGHPCRRRDRFCGNLPGTPAQRPGRPGRGQTGHWARPEIAPKLAQLPCAQTDFASRFDSNGLLPSCDGHRRSDLLAAAVLLRPRDRWCGVSSGRPGVDDRGG